MGALAMRLALSAGILMASLLPAHAQKNQIADAVYLNGKVYTADAKDDVVEAFAVRDERFIAVGSTAEIRKFAGKGTKVVNLKGHFVSPGLTDDHFHNEGGGDGIDLSHVRTMAELLTTIANAAARTA